MSFHQLKYVFIAINLELVFTAHKRSLGQGNIFSSVCQEFCSQGGLPQCMLGYHHHPTPLPSRAGTPKDQALPLEPGTPPPCAVHAGRYGQQAGGMHATGMQSSCSDISRNHIHLQNGVTAILYESVVALAHIFRITGGHSKYISRLG